MSRIALIHTRFLFLRALALLVLAGCVFFAVQALAQVPADSQLAAQQGTLISFDPNGIVAQLVKLLELALLGLGAWVAKRFNTFLLGKSQQNAAAKVGFTLWSKIQAIANHVEVELKPQFDKDLEDGKLTADEAKALKGAAIDLIKRDCQAEIAQLPKLFGLSTDSAVGTFVSGLLEQAVTLIGKTPVGQAIASAIADKPGETVTATATATAPAKPAVVPPSPS